MTRSRGYGVAHSHFRKHEVKHPSASQAGNQQANQIDVLSFLFKPGLRVTTTTEYWHAELANLRGGKVSADYLSSVTITDVKSFGAQVVT